MFGLPERVKRGSTPQKPFEWPRHQYKVNPTDFVNVEGRGLFKIHSIEFHRWREKHENVFMTPVNEVGNFDSEGGRSPFLTLERKRPRY